MLELSFNRMLSLNQNTFGWKFVRASKYNENVEPSDGFNNSFPDWFTLINSKKSQTLHELTTNRPSNEYNDDYLPVNKF